MKSRFFDPNPKLSPYIAGYVYWDDKVPDKKEVLFTVKGNASLAIPLNPDFKCAVKGHKLKFNCLARFEPIIPVLYGQMTSYGKIALKGDVQLIFVVFKPLGLYSFLKDDASLVTDEIIPLSSLKKETYENIQNFKPQADKSIEENILQLEDSLSSCFDSDPLHDEDLPLRKTLQYLFKNKGKETVQELADWSGVSTRTLELQFKKFVGLPPKIYSRIIRFNSLIKQLTETPEIDSFEWIEKYGYADQSHFIKDFKDFTGVPPKKYFKDPSLDSWTLNKSISK